MNELRWILIGFGIVLLAGIYLWGRRSSSAAASTTDARSRPEPTLQASSHAGLLPRYDPALEEDQSSPESPTQDFDDEPITALRSPVAVAARSRGAHEGLPASTHGDRAGEARTHDEGDATGAAGGGAGPHAATRAAPANVSHAAPADARRGRLEPTFNDAAPTEELPAPPPSAPTLSSSPAPQPRRIERRKILSLRLSAMPHRLDGAKLLESLQAESLEHGKYNVFHRRHDDGAHVFSVASMVEPGTFDLDTMSEAQYPGITLFAQLPGPVPGMHALNELIACARRLQQGLGGTLQDERGVPLTVHRIERMRQEVREFERPHGPAARGGAHPEAP